MPTRKRKIITLSTATDDSGKEKTEMIPLPPDRASRLLYPNPVVFLLTESAGRRNVMTLSWLTPANNHGGFAFVIHKRRHSASNLHVDGPFVLSVAHAGQKDLLLACGKVSGGSVDKFNGSIQGLAVDSGQDGGAMKKPTSEKGGGGNMYAALMGDASDDSESEESASKALDVALSSDSECELGSIVGSVATLKCHVVRMDNAADAGHWLIVAQIDEASVNSMYWDGQCFAPTKPELPPLLSFLGSQRFGGVGPLEDPVREARG